MASRFRRLRFVLLALLLLAGAVAGGLLWLARSPQALRFAANRIEAALGGRLQLEGLSGSLAREFRIGRATFEQGGVRVELLDLRIEWSLRALFSRAIDVSSLDIRQVDVGVVPSGNPIALPESLALPVDIRADSVRVGEVEVRIGASSPLVFRDASLGYRGGRTRHAVEDLSVRSPWGPVSGRLGINARRDFPLDGALAWSLADLPVDGQIESAVAGTLERIELAVTGTLLAHAIAGQASLSLFDSPGIAAAHARWSAVDLAKLVDGAPASAVDILATLEPSPEAPLAGRFQLANAMPGALSAERLPLVAAIGMFHVADRALEITALDADFGNAGAARGDLRFSAAGVDVGLDVSRVNLSGLHAKLARTALDGRIDATLAGPTQHATATLAQRDLHFAVEATRQDDAIEVTRLAVNHRGGRLDGSGRIRLDGQQAFAANLRFSGIDPSRFVDVPGARLTGSTRLEGTLAPAWRLNGNFELRDSHLRNRPLAGQGAFSADASRVTTPGTTLRVGGNRLHASGEYGRTGDVLVFEVDAQQLAELDPRLAGRFTAEGTVSGRVSQPAIRISFAGEELALADYRAAALHGEAEFTQGADPAFDVSVDAGQLDLPSLGEFASARVALDGKRSAHTLKLDATGSVLDAQAELRGSYADASWTGQVAAFENRGPYPMQLTAAVPLRISRQAFSLGAAGIVGDFGEAHIKRIEFGAGRLETAGEFSSVQLAALMALAGVDPGETSLRLRGAWEIATTPRVNGSFHVERESGGIALGGSPPYTFRPSELAIQGEIVEDRLSLAGRAVDEELGEARLRATASPVAGARPPALGRDSALEAHIEIAVPTLRALDRFVGANASIAGNARADIEVGGTLAEPDVAGTVDVADLRIAAPQHALFLTDGRLHAELLEQELRITELAITGGSGRLSATGRLGIGGADADSAIEWKAEEFRLLSSPTRRLTLDGAGSLALRDRVLLARGEVRASQAHFALTQPQGPRLADDVKVVGRAPRAAPRRAALPLDIDLVFDFGERFHVEERGLDALLSGKLRARTGGDGRLAVTGTVNVDRGTYLAYGQTLFVENGRLYFNGPANDPGLEITALRRNLPVQVGLRITGTALTPIVQLISEPPMPDNEKLSWLILGRSPSNTSNADAAMLASAAEALIAGPSGVPITTRMARRLGLDEIGLRSHGDEGEAVTLGRRLSDRVYLFIERGISAATTALIIEYALTRELRLRAEAGDVNGLGISWGRTLE